MKKKTETINKNQEEIKNIISEIKYMLEGSTSWLDEAEDRISELEGKEIPRQRSSTKKDKKKNEDSLRELQDNMKYNSIEITGIPEGEEKEQEIENLFEKIVTVNFPNQERGKATQVQEAQRVPIKLNEQRPTPKHITIKIANLKDKERILKAAREKQEVTYKGDSIRLAADFSMVMLQARREWQEIFQVMRTRGLQPRLLYPARLSIKIEGKVGNFPDKRRLKEYTSTNPALQDMLKGPL